MRRALNGFLVIFVAAHFPIKPDDADELKDVIIGD